MDRSEILSSFIGLTGASQEEATSILEGANWDLQTAAERFFEQVSGDYDQMAEDDQDPSFAVSSGPAGPSAIPPQQTAQPRAKSSVPRGGIRGFSDLDKDDSDDEDDTGNEYYTGGEKSGQVVKGNDKKESVEEYFERVRQLDHASEGVIDRSEPSNRPRAFSGRARRLEDSGPAPDEDVPAASAAERAQPAGHVVITFYADRVFTVNDGEPRDVTDPANRAFLEQLSKGQAPDELIPADGPAGDIQVEMKRSLENYKPPKAKPFSGKGRTLGGQSAASSSTAAVSQAASASQPSSSKVWEGVDESQPTTSVQLRLADGSRMVARFNTTHTIGDIRRLIAASARQSPANYRLATAFPAAELTDDSKTISDAGLQNAVIIQKQ